MILYILPALVKLTLFNAYYRPASMHKKGLKIDGDDYQEATCDMLLYIFKKCHKLLYLYVTQRITLA